MEKPNYYSVTTAQVRYDKKLSLGARHLFGEISALSNNKGYCWAKNKYFADLYDVSTRTICTWISELEAQGHVQVIEENGTRTLKMYQGGYEENFLGVGRKLPRGRKKTSYHKEEKQENEGLVEPPKEGNITPNTTLNTTYNSPADNFEEFMEAQGYKHDSLVDSDGGMAEWWEDDSGRKLSKSEIKSLRTKWRPPLPSVPDPSMADTEKLVEVIKRTLEKQYGAAPVVGNEAKTMIRQNLIKKYDKDFIREYAQWYFVDSQIDKKWRFSIQAFVSERFINSYLSEQ